MGQDKPAPKLLEFEVASVKPIDPNVQMRFPGIKIYPGGRVVVSGLPLKTLLVAAFRLSYWQISGGGAWTQNDMYDIEAKAPENSNVTNFKSTRDAIDNEHLREMLQALLIDRFQLKFHSQTKTGQVYMLVRNGKTLGLQPAKIPSQDPDPSVDRSAPSNIGYAGGRWVISNITMPLLAKFASDYVVHAPVLDRTELSGFFDYRQTQPDLEPNYSDNTDSFLRLIPELGLKLERTKGPVETFVIDHAAKPSPN